MNSDARMLCRKGLEPEDALWLYISQFEEEVFFAEDDLTRRQAREALADAVQEAIAIRAVLKANPRGKALEILNIFAPDWAKAIETGNYSRLALGKENGNG